METKTDTTTPIDSLSNDHVIRALKIYGREKMTEDGSLESWINLGADRLEKLQAEVARLRDAFSAYAIADSIPQNPTI
jgi:hypothetical protein